MRLTEAEVALLRALARTPARAGRPPGAGPRHRRHRRPRGRRPGHPPAPQDRGRPQDPALPADRARRGLHAGARLMQRPHLRVLTAGSGRGCSSAGCRRSLFGRSLLIIVLPVALMQVAVTWVFFDAHWQTVTSRLSEGLAGDIAWAVESYERRPAPAPSPGSPSGPRTSLGLSVAFQPGRSPARRARRAPSSPPSTARWSGRWPSGWTGPSGSTPPATPPTSTSGCRPTAGCCASSRPRDRAFATQGHIFVLWLTVRDPAADRRRDPVHPQPGPRHRAAGRRRRAFGRGGDVAGLQAARRARGAPRRRGLPRHEAAASSATSTSAPPCWPRSATTCAPRSPG